MHAIQQCSATTDLSDDERYLAACIVLQTKAWAYYSVLLNTPVIWTNECATAATDGAYIYINPDFFMGLPTDGQRAFLLGHEVGHVVLRHPMRGLFYHERGFHSTDGDGKRIPFDPATYNQAADYVINADLVASGLEPIPSGCFSKEFGRDHLVDEVYLTMVRKELEAAKERAEQEAADDSDQDDSDDTSDQSDVGDSGSDESDSGDESEGSESGESDSDESGADGSESDADDGDESGEGSGADSDESDSDGSGSGAGADGESGEGEGDGSGTSDESGESGPATMGDHGGHDEHFYPVYNADDAEDLDRQIEEDRAEIERRVDDALDQLDDLADRGERPPSVGKGFGAAGYRHSGDGQASSTDWRGELADFVTRLGRDGDVDWSRLHRRSLYYGTVVPRRKGTLDRVAFIVDISDSVGRRQLHQAMIELAACIDTVQPTSGCLVLWTNTSVVGTDEVFSGQELLELTVPCGGGTVLSSGIRFLEDNGLDADVLLVFTDGEFYSLSEWQAMTAAGALVILDSHPDSYNAAQMRQAGTRTIVANDTGLAR